MTDQPLHAGTPANTSIDTSILRCLDAGIRYAGGIAETTGLPGVTVRAVMRDFEDRGYIQRSGTAGHRTLWAITDLGRAQLSDPVPDEPADNAAGQVTARIVGLHQSLTELGMAQCGRCHHWWAAGTLVDGVCADCAPALEPATCATCTRYRPYPDQPGWGHCGLYMAPKMDGSHNKTPDDTCGQHRTGEPR